MSKYLKCLGFILIIEFIFILVGGEYETLLVKSGMSSNGDNILYFLGFPISLIIIIGFSFWFFPKVFNQLLNWLYLGKKAIIFFLAGFLMSSLIFALVVFLTFQTNNLNWKNSPLELLNIIFLSKAIIISLLIGITEETIYRGIVMAYFLQNTNKIFSIIFISLFFSAGHLNYNGLLPYVSAFIMGIVCTDLLFRTGSLFPAIGLHSGWDFSYSVFKNNILFNSKTVFEDERQFEFYQLVFLVMLYLIIVFYFIKRERQHIN